ncbi:MAG TPA: LacI family DNA-binding transcriptional regulator [Capsulimonadaceae bacterium]|jgi:LacI family transcriptional regulator
MATISDIAKASGVSKASVSYVLNNRQGSVSAETRERVLQAMRDLNYRPSPLFMRKHAKKTEVLGVAFTHPSLTMLTDHPYFSLILDGILTATTAIGWDLILFTTSRWSDFHKAMRSKCDGRCDGVILVGLAENTGLVEVFKERGMPFVCVNMGSDIDGATTVDVDNEAAAKTMTDHLISLGHRRIAFLAGQLAYPNAVARQNGYMTAIAGANIPFWPDYVPAGGFMYESGYDRAMKLLDLPPGDRPTALFCASDVIAFGAMAAVKERGLTIPGDITVVGFDDIPGAKTCEPPLTTIKQPLAELGKSAAEMLLRHIDGVTDMGETIVLPTSMIRRETDTAPKATV